jgi:hypothetical protein
MRPQIGQFLVFLRVERLSLLFLPGLLAGVIRLKRSLAKSQRR